MHPGRRLKRYDEIPMPQGTTGWIELDNVQAIIKFLIHQSNKTQTDLSKEMGISNTTMSEWYRGIVVPGSDKLLTLCDLCGFEMKIVPKTMEIAIDEEDELISPGRYDGTD